MRPRQSQRESFTVRYTGQQSTKTPVDMSVVKDPNVRTDQQSPRKTVLLDSNHSNTVAGHSKNISNDVKDNIVNMSNVALSSRPASSVFKVSKQEAEDERQPGGSGDMLEANTLKNVPVEQERRPSNSESGDVEHFGAVKIRLGRRRKHMKQPMEDSRLRDRQLSNRHAVLYDSNHRDYVALPIRSRYSHSSHAGLKSDQQNVQSKQPAKHGEFSVQTTEGSEELSLSEGGRDLFHANQSNLSDAVSEGREDIVNPRGETASCTSSGSHDWEENMARAALDDTELRHMEEEALRFLDDGGMLDEHFLDIFGEHDFIELAGGLSSPAVLPVTTYPVGPAKYAECQVCFVWTELHLRPCCEFPVCTTCLGSYFETQVSMANVRMQCIAVDCRQNVHRDEISALLDVAHRTKFNQFLVDANREPHRKTCPRCSYVLTIQLDLLKNETVRKYGYRVECVECHLLWCFPCQAPWHEGIKCKVYQRGDRLLKTWAREQHYGQANAQKCPKCKVYIQRSSGCDHMTCSRCKTNFCYRCGEQFRELKFIGNHYSKLSIFGCKYRYKPNSPVQRKLVRGSIFGGKLLAAPVLGGLAIGAGVVVIGVGAIVLPIYGAYRLHRRLQQQKRAKQQRKIREEMWKKLEDMQKRGEELDISNPISNTDDIIAEMAASRLGTGSPSVLSSASDDSDSVYVVHIERSSVESDSSMNLDVVLNHCVEDKSCQTSCGGGMAGCGIESRQDTPFCRRRDSRCRRRSFDSHSLPPDIDVRFRPPSPAYLKFVPPRMQSIHTKPSGGSAKDADLSLAEHITTSRIPPDGCEVKEIAELFFRDVVVTPVDDELEVPVLASPDVPIENTDTIICATAADDSESFSVGIKVGETFNSATTVSTRDSCSSSIEKKLITLSNTVPFASTKDTCSDINDEESKREASSSKVMTLTKVKSADANLHPSQSAFSLNKSESAAYEYQSSCTDCTISFVDSCEKNIKNETTLTIMNGLDNREVSSKKSQQDSAVLGGGGRHSEKQNKYVLPCDFVIHL